MDVVAELVRAREAFDRRDWVAAYDGLSEPRADASLTADDFARLGTTAYLLGHRNDCVQALQRAYRIHLDLGDAPAAVRCAFWLATVLLNEGETAVGGGWVSRGEHLLEELGEDVVERGYVLIHLMLRHVFSGDPQTALELAEEIEGYGRRFGDPDLLAMGVSSRGRLLLRLGRVQQGLALLDEAMTDVSTGEVSPIFAGEIYCSTIEACQEVADFARAAEWTAMLSRWCDDQPGLVHFTGQCAVHRGQIMKAHGAFPEALQELEGAVARYVAVGSPPAVGLAWAERGDVLRIRGELTEAETAYQRAVDSGHDPQPGLALLRLAQGRTQVAAASVRRLLEERGDEIGRSHLLPAAVEILLAEDAVEEAEPLADELSRIAHDFGCGALEAAAAHARAGVRLRRGDARAALPDLRGALRGWQSLDMPYHAAHTAALIGSALRAMGDEDAATGELEAAHRTLVRLGARPAAEAVHRLLGPDAPGGLTAREVEVLRLVAAGRSNAQIAAELVLSEKTVARHLSNILTKLDVPSRTGAAAFAYEHGLV